MDKTSTKKLLLYYFNETELADSVEVQHAIDYNYYTAEEFNHLKETLGYLDGLLCSPQKSTVENILNYSGSWKKAIRTI